MSANIRVLRPIHARKLGYPQDRRKRRSMHRQNAKHLYREGAMFEIIQWHLWQAKNLK